ncbi:MAG: hypothetical protein ACRD1C_13995 [Terriglobales bacterium]
MRRWLGWLGAAVGLGGLALAQAPVWSWQGPGQLVQAESGTELAGPLNAVVVATAATGNPVVLAGGAGGVWRFNPDSASWAASGLGGPVASLAMAADGTLYAGTGELDNGDGSRAGTGVWVSHDAGISWSTPGGGSLVGLAIRRLEVDPADAAHLLAVAAVADDSPAAAQSGLYVSNDGGTSWAPLLEGEFWDVAWQGSSVLVAGASSVELSTDNGASFTAVGWLAAAWVRAAVVAAPAGGFLLLLAAAGGGASLWTISSAGAGSPAAALPQLNGQRALALGENASGQILAGGSGLWLATGGSWQAIAVGAGEQHAIGTDSHGGFWTANAHGLWYLAPGGNTATAMNTGLANAAPLGLVAAPAGFDAVLDGGGVASGTAHPGASWTVSNPALQLSALTPDPLQAGALYALSAGELLHSPDGGASWQTAALPPAAQGTPTVLACAPQGLWMGTSSGEVVGPQGEQYTFAEGVGAVTTDASGIWVASGAQIYTSVDDGADWSAIGSPAGRISALAVDPQQPGVIAVAGAAGIIWTVNSGATWSAPQSLADGAPVSALDFDAQQSLWAATLGRGIWSASLAPGSKLSVQPPPASVTAGAPITLRASLEEWGAAVAGAEVGFAASQNGDAVWSGAAAADAAGVASVTFSLPRTGTVTVLVTAADGLTAAPAETSFSVQAAAVAALSLISGAGQTQAAGTMLVQPIAIAASDAYGNPVAGVTVTLAGGQFEPSSAVTGMAGRVQATLTLPASSGTQTYSASAAGVASLQWQETAFANSDFQLLLTAPGQPMAPGKTAELALSIAPVNGFAEAVSLSCEQPLGDCSVSPSSVQPGQTAVVTVAALDNQPALTVQVEGTTAAGVTKFAAAAVPQQAFTMSAGETAVSAQAGAATAAVPLSLTALNGLQGAVQLQVMQADGSVLPAGLVAVFRPAAAALAGTSAPLQVQVALQVAASAASAGSGASSSWWWWLTAMAMGLALRAGKRRWRGAALAAVCLLAAGCGGAASAPAVTTAAATPPTTVYELTVVASVQGLQASVPLQVTVTSP